MPRTNSAIPRTLDSNRFNLVREIFLDAQRFRGHARRSFLAQRCAGDSDLLNQVIDLLKHDDSDRSVLDKPVIKAADQAIFRADRPVDKPSTKARGTHSVASVGRFRLLQVLGEGSSGVTSLARNPDATSRKAVVKVLHSEFSDLTDNVEQVLSRIRVDHRTLSVLRQHASSRLIECGSISDGSVFIATEFVPGEPILSYCDRVRAPLRARLLLFLDACASVHAAHQCGAMHGGITPGNTLVRMAGDVPTVCMLDFGISRALHDCLGNRREWVQSRLTHGAPEYLAPEQAGETPKLADPSADVYALGALLYELLVGAPPFDRFALRRAGMGDFPRILNEQPPLDPGAKASELCAGSPDVADRRGLGVREFVSELKNDLASIPLKALQKAPVNRYASVDLLAEDIRNYLDEKPIGAAPTFGDRMRKIVGRFRSGDK